MSSYLSSFFTMIDIFGYSPSLQVNRQKNFKTTFGGFISLGIIPFIILAIILFGKEFILKQRPTLIIANQYDLQPPKMAVINDTNFVVAFGIYDSNFSLFQHQTYFSFSAEYHVINQEINNDKITSREEIKSLDIVRCKQKKSKFFKEELNDIDTDNLFCLQYGNINLDGFIGGSNVSFVEFNFKECKNTTDKETNCKSKDEIIKKLSNSYIGIFFSDYSIEPADYKNPAQSRIRSFFSPFSLKKYNQIWMYLKHIIFKSDVGWLFYDFEYYNYLVLDEFRENTFLRDGHENFVSFKILMGSKTVTYERLYLKLEMIAANCGGIIKCLLLLGESLVRYFRKLCFKSFIVSHFFNTKSFSKEDEDISTPNKRKSLNIINNNFVVQQHDESNSHSLSRSKSSISKKSDNSSNDNAVLNNLNNFIQNNALQRENGISGVNAGVNFNAINANTQKLPVTPNINQLLSLANTRKDISRRRNFVANDINIMKLVRETSVKAHRLQDSDILKLIFCCNGLTRSKLNLVNTAYDKLSLRFDWLHFLKTQQELELIKSTIYNKSQRDIFALCLKYHDNNIIEELFFSSKYNFSKLPDDIKEELKESYQIISRSKNEKTNINILKHLDEEIMSQLC